MDPPLDPLGAGDEARLAGGAFEIPHRSLSFAAPLGHQPGRYIIVRRPVPALLQRAVVVIGIMLVALVMASIPMARALASPLEKLGSAARALGSGDLSARTGLRRNDEVGDLAVAFDEAAEKIERLIRSEKELLANVSHELRTPLARMKVVLELIDSRDESIRRRLAALHEEVDELDWLIADMLTATRLDLASLPLHKVPLKVADVVEKARQRALALRPQPLVEVRVEQDLSLEVDEALLARAIDNLLDNARKYGNGTPVEVEARREGSQALIAVRDRGPGFAEAELEHLFDPFFRGESARGQAPGFGLGLALAKRVVEAHGGTATALNVEGGGARIELRLPAIPRPPSYS